MTDKTATFDEAALRQKLDEIHSQVDKTLEKANGQAADALTISTEVKNEIKALTTTAAEINERLTAIEAAKGELPEGQNPANGLGTLFKSDKWDAFLSQKVKSVALESKTTLVNATRNGAQPLVSPNHITSPAHAPERRLRVWDIVPKAPAGSNVISWPRETFTNNAAPRKAGSPEVYTEGASLAESAVSFARVDRPVEDVGHFIPCSKQILQDAQFLEAYMQQRLNYHLMLKVNGYLITGTGANGQPYGINTEATAWAAHVSPDDSIGNRIQRAKYAKRQLETTDYIATHIVLNAGDWSDMESQRVNPGTDDRYILGDPGANAAPTLWGMRVVADNSQPAGTFTVGDFEQGLMVFEQGGMEYGAYYEDDQNVRKGLVTLTANARLANCVWLQTAFITGSF